MAVAVRRAAARRALVRPVNGRFTLPWRGRVDCRAQRRQAGWGELPLLEQEITPPRLTSRYARCFADPPPPGEGEESKLRAELHTTVWCRSRQIRSTSD